MYGLLFVLCYGVLMEAEGSKVKVKARSNSIFIPNTASKVLVQLNGTIPYKYLRFKTPPLARTPFVIFLVASLLRAQNVGMKLISMIV